MAPQTQSRMCIGGGRPGPSDPTLWLTRPLGYWEEQMLLDWPPGTPGPRRCNCTHLAHLLAQSIDQDLFRYAVYRHVVRQ